MPKTTHELKCFCKFEPLLATYGVDERNQLYIHVKIWKQRRIFGNIVVTVGKVSIQCRDCFRWHNVTILPGNKASLTEVEPPQVVSAHS